MHGWTLGAKKYVTGTFSLKLISNQTPRRELSETVKKLGLVALATLMATTFLSASSAIAESTALCGAEEEVCASPVTHIHETSLIGHKGALKTSLLTVECGVLFLGDELEGLGSPLVIHGEFTYTECGNCKVFEENGPAEVRVLKEGTEVGSGAGEILVHVECPGVNCRYNGVGLKSTVKGSLSSTETNGKSQS